MTFQSNLLSLDTSGKIITALDIHGGLTKSSMNHMPGRKWK
jgi:hypothetical protein